MPNWKPIRGYLYPYRANEDGRIEIFRDGKWRYVSPYVWRKKGSTYGVLMVHMWLKDGHRTNYKVKNVVARAFYGNKVDGMDVGLRNGLTTDCSLSNIILQTRSEVGKKGGGPNRRAVEKVDPDGNVVALYSSVTEAATANFAHRKSILRRCQGKAKNPYSLDGYNYRYEDEKKKRRPKK